MTECKRCLLLESGSEDTLKAIREHIKRIPEAQRTDESSYAERLKKCRECESLISGTCVKCGCYVEFRAAFLVQKCPDTKSPKW